MNNKESLLEDISNVFYGNREDKENGTSLIPNDRVVSELLELVKLDAIKFFKWLYENYNEIHDGLPISGNTSLGGMTIYIDHVEHPFEYAYELYKQQSL